MKFDRKFLRYACPGDTITTDITDKIQLVATIVFDEDCKPTDFDCYEERDIERWNLSHWNFVGVVLSLQSHDGTIKKSLGSLWGIECNFGGPEGNNDYLTDVANELIDEKEILAALREIYQPVSRAIESLTH